MELEFRKYDGTTVALNPRIERRGEQLTMKLNEQNCDYFLLLSRAPGGCVDLQEKGIQAALLEKKNLFPDVRDERLQGHITVSCIEYSDYRVNECAIDLPDRIAEYTVAGCREEQGRLIIFLPEEGMSCTASVSLTVTYHISRASKEAPRRLFGKQEPQKAFFAVEMGPVPNYPDGGIVYQLDGLKWNYPITCEMLENGRFYIEAGYGMPKFSAAVSGLELKQI